jgi:hypothetical protein|tara:strand:+ start:3927 stop:5522 length:1596 start_codon:yes stop_codon:yes gene_type:complete
VAIVQISRIQHRRGRKLAGTGMPQLASGELGWALDTQQLYIGNGSTSEGAPTVGNTRILTETDNIFDFAEVYSYKPTDNLWGVDAPPTRSLQERLDEVVSIESFGWSYALTPTAQTAAIQSAIDKLFLNQENRVVLYFPQGNYEINDIILVPPYATLRGAGKEKTRITSSSNIIFQTRHYNPAASAEGITTNNQPKYIEISGMTLTVDSALYGAIDLYSCTNSTFKDLRIKGIWEFGENNFPHIGILMRSYSNAITCQHNIFDEIELDSLNTGVYSDYDITHNTFGNIYFNKMRYGIAFGTDGAGTGLAEPGQLIGPSYNTVENCIFDSIDKQGFIISLGDYNVSKDNKYLDVGNDNSEFSISVTSCIEFTTTTNVSDNDLFERTKNYMPNRSSDANFNLEYVPEILGRANYEIKHSGQTPIAQQISEIQLLKFPIVDGTITIDYVYNETSFDILQSGTIKIISNIAVPDVYIEDETVYTGTPLYQNALAFTVAQQDFGSVTAGIDTIVLNVTNTIPVVTDNFHYTVRVKA